MEINDFKETNENKQEEMEKKLSKFKLENVLSLWYLIKSASKATIIGSKG
ncbi:hypothetical protein [Syntrophaceticus schinkii]|uniref:Uncharacterized protein n=1 Tax=Syntrophaceticus schinkii TaxID=499207 RepID=A0A0B7ML36_9FIRM|nr:hypothetical protein [Syntrophaceticus schinkii]CEO88397.1 conserved hypothetical protein [Syntrophaceticus schinkii]HHV42348.1 hypothetical protein [Clostridiaceae bacterium]